MMLNSLSHARQKITSASLVVASVYLLVLGMLAYGLARYQTVPLLLGWCLLFGLYLLLWGSKETSLKLMLIVAAGARLLLLPSIPSLSDDFYRFLWDGHLLVEGLHPFSHPPEWYRQAGAPIVQGLTPELYEGLNSKQYFTIYPPLAQALFALAAWIGGSNILTGVVLLRLPLLLAEAGTIWLMLKLLKAYHLSKRHVLLYALNPLVILELVGNLHLEALAIFFLLLLLWALKSIDAPSTARSNPEESPKETETPPPAICRPDLRKDLSPVRGEKGEKAKITWLAVAFAGAVAAKLWPLLLGPYLLMKLGWRKGKIWLLLSSVLLLLLFIPFFGMPLLQGMFSSLSLYFQRFEFNASLYYVLRALGQWLIGFNPIVQLGPLLALLAAGLILYFSKKAVKRGWRIPKTILLLYGLFLLCATTVHPWYVIPLVALMPFTPFRFPLVWSGLVFLTYAGYHAIGLVAAGYQEPLGLVALEYGIVLAVLVWELRRYQAKPRNQQTRQQALTTKS